MRVIIGNLLSFICDTELHRQANPRPKEESTKLSNRTDANAHVLETSQEKIKSGDNIVTMLFEGTDFFAQ